MRDNVFAYFMDVNNDIFFVIIEYHRLEQCIAYFTRDLINFTSIILRDRVRYRPLRFGSVEKLNK